VGFYNPRSTRFGLRYSLTAGPAGRTGHLGFHGAKPLIGDWRGRGLDGTGYYDRRYGTFHLLRAGAHGMNIKARFGPKHMIPLAGDWNGLGRHDGVGFYNPWSGTFHLRNRASKGRGNEIVRFGPPHMIPLAGAWFGS